MNLRTPGWPSQQNTFDVCSLLAVYRGEFGERVKASQVWHDCKDIGVFLVQWSVARVVVEYYFGTLVCANLKMQQQVQKTYGESVMSLTVKEFSTAKIKFPESFLDWTRMERTAWIVPSHFICIQFLNNIRYLLECRFTKMQSRTQLQKNNVSFAQKHLSVTAC